MFPLESPVIASPFSAKAMQRTYLGFSCFWKNTKNMNTLNKIIINVPRFLCYGDFECKIKFHMQAINSKISLNADISLLVILKSKCNKTSNSPWRFVRVLPSIVQKLMWDFPQVTIRLASMGWKTAPSTESLEHCKIVSGYLTQIKMHSISQDISDHCTLLQYVKFVSKRDNFSILNI